MRLDIQDIGGGVVRQSIRIGGQYVMAGTRLTGDEIREKFRISNLRCMIETQKLSVWPRTGREPGTARDGLGQEATGAPEGSTRHIINRGFGVYDVIEGVRLNDKPIDKETAQAIVAQGATPPH